MLGRSRLFVGDTVMVDVVVKLEALPVRGGDALASERVVAAGGGFNAMAAAARQGVPVTYLGKMGTGPFADVARSHLVEEHVELAPITPSPIDAGLCFVFVEADGERSFVTSPGAEKTIGADELRGVAVTGGDYVFLSGYNFVYEELARSFLDWLDGLDEGAMLAFDPGPRVLDLPVAVLERVLARTDWLLCNEVEATALTGTDDSVTAARLLASRTRGGRALVHTGARGCDAFADGGAWHADGFAANVVDTNGAGDTHNGVFLAELIRGSDVAAALRRANAASAIAIGRLGPATCPWRAEIDALIATT